MSAEPPLLEVRHLSKQFPGVRALDGVSFAVAAGEVHALVGENGAGKSTLLSIMSGIQQADAGEILLEGREISLRSPAAARRSGIAMVHQELSLCPNMSAAENIFLGSEPRRAGWVERGRMNADAAVLLGGINAGIDPRQEVASLGLAEQQLVEICRALALSPKVIVLDEPTASLGADRVQDLLAVIDRLRRRGLGIVYVSHRLEEVLAIADRITVLRDGSVAGRLHASDATQEELVRLMVGRAVARPAERKAVAGSAPVRLEVQGLTGVGSFKDVNLTLRAGEIVGLAGLMGCHRETFVRSLFGLAPIRGGEIRVDGQAQHLRSPRDAIRLGLGYVPADRKSEGLVLDMGLHDNLSLAALRRLGRAGFLSFRRRRALGAAAIRNLSVKAPSLRSSAGSLSGGNQQKIVLGRWLAADRRVLIFDEPTRGIDVGAKAQIRELLQELADRGLAVLATSSDLPELMELCDRIVVMNRGRVTAEFDRQDFDAEQIGRMATI